MATRIRRTGAGTTGARIAVAARRTSSAAGALLVLVAVGSACATSEMSEPAAQVATAEPAPPPAEAPEPPAAEAPAPPPAEAPAPPPAEAPEPPAAEAPEPPAEGRPAIQIWDLHAASTGADLAALLTPKEAACLESMLGGDFEAMMSSPLMGGAVELLESGGSGASPIVACLTAEQVVSARISLLSAAAGGFSAGTRDCVVGLLEDNPAAVGALSQSDEPADNPWLLRIISCLTPAEAAALTSPGDEPAPDPGDVGCLMGQLAGDASGERIIDVLSGNDPTGEGLTIAESALLGQAVEACGIETEFGFPDAAGGPAPDDFGQDTPPADIGGGGECTPGLVLHPGDSCHYDEFSILIRPDGSALVDGNIGTVSMAQAVLDGQSVDLNGFVASRSGAVWTIEGLP